MRNIEPNDEIVFDLSLLSKRIGFELLDEILDEFTFCISPSLNRVLADYEDSSNNNEINKHGKKNLYHGLVDYWGLDKEPIQENVFFKAIDELNLLERVKIKNVAPIRKQVSHNLHSKFLDEIKNEKIAQILAEEIAISKLDRPIFCISSSKFRTIEYVESIGMLVIKFVENKRNVIRTDNWRAKVLLDTITFGLLYTVWGLVAVFTLPYGLFRDP